MFNNNLNTRPNTAIGNWLTKNSSLRVNNF